MSPLKANAGPEPQQAIKLSFPNITVFTTPSRAADDMRYWMYQYLTNALLLLPQVDFEDTGDGIKMIGFEIEKVMARQQHDEAARKNIANRLHSARKTGKLELE